MCKAVYADDQRDNNGKQDHGAEFVLQMVKVREFFPMSCTGCRGAIEDKPNAVDIRGNGEQSECYFGDEQRAGIGSGEHESARNKDNSERRNFNKQVNAFMQYGKNEFLRAALAEQSPFKQRFGENAPQPDANESEMQQQEY
jgi:hypothetical protein